jgi:hypothetical protein
MVVHYRAFNVQRQPFECASDLSIQLRRWSCLDVPASIPVGIAYEIDDGQVQEQHVSDRCAN